MTIPRGRMPSALRVRGAPAACGRLAPLVSRAFRTSASTSQQQDNRVAPSAAAATSLPPLHTQCLPLDPGTGDLRALLAFHFPPLDQFDFVATYGSAAFKQVTEEEEAEQAQAQAQARANTPVAPASRPVGGDAEEEPMLDLIFAVADPLAFHRANLGRNPTHYSFLRWCPWSWWEWVQEYGAGVWYNTLIRLSIPERDLAAAAGSEGGRGPTKLIKYGVISTARLQKDLTEWETLYVAGRMHKPMNILHSSDGIRLAAQQNLKSALVTSLLLIDSKSHAAPARPTAAIDHKLHVLPTSDGDATSPPLPLPPAVLSLTGQSLFTRVCSLSYAGDIRMAVGAENPRKVEKIVRGNWTDLVKLYRTQVRAVLGDAPMITKLTDEVLLPIDATRRDAWVDALPIQVQRELDREPLLVGASSTARARSAAYRALSPADRYAALTAALARIVRRSSRQQTMKGLLTAGLRKSVRYAMAKVRKAMKAKKK